MEILHIDLMRYYKELWLKHHTIYIWHNRKMGELSMKNVCDKRSGEYLGRCSRWGIEYQRLPLERVEFLESFPPSSCNAIDTAHEHMQICPAYLASRSLPISAVNQYRDGAVRAGSVSRKSCKYVVRCFDKWQLIWPLSCILFLPAVDGILDEFDETHQAKFRFIAYAFIVQIIVTGIIVTASGTISERKQQSPRP
jgi:hypothetical protein